MVESNQTANNNEMVISQTLKDLLVMHKISMLSNIIFLSMRTLRITRRFVIIDLMGPRLDKKVLEVYGFCGFSKLSSPVFMTEKCASWDNGY